MRFSPADFPLPPETGAEVATIDGALLSAATFGRLHVRTKPNRWHRGAVYTEAGELVVASQRQGGFHGDLVAGADPDLIDPATITKQLSGTWLYGGSWMRQFGHFLTETLTTLWPERPENLAGLVFHGFTHPYEVVEEWEDEFVRLAGYGDLPIHIVTTGSLTVPRGGMRVERLLLPTRTYVPNAWALPESTVAWDRVVASARRRLPGSDRPARVYLSRTSHHSALDSSDPRKRSDAERDAALDDVFASRGFTIAFPEQLSIAEQASLVSDADVVAGQAGSALHLAAFTSSAQVIEVADARVPDDHLPNQVVVNAVRGHSQALITRSTPVSEVPALLDALLDRDPNGR